MRACVWGQFNAKRIFNLLSKMRMAIAYPSQPVSFFASVIGNSQYCKLIFYVSASNAAYLLDGSEVGDLVILLVMDSLRLVDFLFT